MAGHYNGFTPRQRAVGGNEVNRAFLMGEVDRPTICEACAASVPGAKVMAHNENYDTPLDFFSVCYVCHMMIHCRFRAKDRWQEYLDALRGGAVMAQAFDWLSFRRWYLQGPLEDRIIGQVAPRAESFLDLLPTEPIDHAPVGVVPKRLLLKTS